MLMSYVLDAGKNRHNMDSLSEIHLNHKTIAFKDLVGTGKKEINFKSKGLNKKIKDQQLFSSHFPLKISVLKDLGDSVEIKFAQDIQHLSLSTKKLV